MSTPMSAFPCAYPFVDFGGDGGSVAYPGAAEARYPTAGTSIHPALNHPASHYSPLPGMNFSPLPCAGAGLDGATVLPSIATAAAYAAGGNFPSFPSLELPASAAAASADFYACAAASGSPMGDLYFCSPHPYYAESPLMPLELYGAGNSGAGSPTLFYGANGRGTGAGAGQTAAAGGSLVSSASLSGSRFPQWYLPRGYCTAPPYAAGAASSCGAFGDAGSTGITPTSLSMAATSAEEEVLGSLDVRARFSSGPQPPRLGPQVGAPVPGHFALPPPTSAGLAAPPAAASPCSASLSFQTSPASRGACPPQFLAYDGRAYGLPLCTAPTNTTDALPAAAPSPLLGAGKPATGGRSPVDVVTPLAGLHPARASVSKAGALHHQVSAGPQPPTAVLATPPHRVGLGGAVPAAAVGAVDPAPLCSPDESVLLADVHARLLLQQHQHQLAAQKRKQRAAQRRATVKALCGADLTEAAEAAAALVAVVSAHATDAAVGDEGRATAPAAASSAAREASDDEAAAAAVATLSPIPHVLTDADAESATEAEHSRSDRTADAEGLAAAAPPTQDALDRVLTVPGVLWRHDPYSRRVLPTPDSSEVSDDVAAAEPVSAAPAAMQAHRPYASSVPTSPLLRRRLTEVITAHQEASASAVQSCCSSADSSVWRSPMSVSVGLDVTQPQPSVRRQPTKKVCVRHYVSGDGDGSGCPPHDCSGIVGSLATVREAEAVSRRVVPRPAAVFAAAAATACKPHDEPAALAAAAAAATPPQSVNIASAAVVGATDSAAAAAAPAAAASTVAARERPPQTVAAARSSSAPVLLPARTPLVAPTASPAAAALKTPPTTECGAAMASASVRSEHLVPLPRSEQLRDAADSKAVPGTRTRSSSRRSSADRSAATESSYSTSLASVQMDVAAAASAAAAWPVAPQRPKPYSSPLLGEKARTSVQVAATCWAWQLRSSRVYPPPRPGDMGVFAAEFVADSLDDIDVVVLQRLWHRLNRSGCYKDALARRRKVIGEGSNCSTRLLRRVVPLPRRVRNRRRGLEADDADAPRFTVLEEADMKYVYVLYHRFRRSTAVGCECFAVGTTVVVDGDMGIETGTVELVLTREEYDGMSESKRHNAHLVGNLDFALASSIHRAAHADELVVRSTIQTPLEEATLEFLRFVATQPHLFRSCRIAHMRFVDVEFQADAQKLYVHYTCDAPVRFLELATYLNHIFHCRIWMRMASGDCTDGSCSDE